MYKRKWLLVVTLLALVFAGCAGSNSNALPQAPESRADKLARQGFTVIEELTGITFPSTLDSWGYIDDKALWVESRPKRYYLITLSFPCRELSFTQEIGFRSRGTQLMKGDDLIVPGPPVRDCQVETIFSMELDRKKRAENQ
ncbi:DUF6491 family protein [Porticoccaceae bacterium LTM1]|nr:DUF6491 family protein [Porticoccaceae bacterium LTM1]